ncbi:hypothetical protein MCUN1_002060 [Malassezia cuniculi]|uniref:Aldehyde dehydrogenase n=1 Tax=Malassezia cuniculi TaxID=948313 RepID=A0AAF0EUD4_9BASI|nr:hypothetical protein MCUN1_002060 [Malassezia cuniculi]
MSNTLKHTPVAEIPGIVNGLREAFLTGKTRDLSYRKKQLKQFVFMIKDNQDAFIQAINKDLGRPPMETEFGEIFSILNELVEYIDNLSKWARDTHPPSELAFVLHKSRVRKEPKGTVLVMGAWNYPITVQLGPVVPAIAAGNTVVIKPSELAPHSAQLIAELVPKYLDPQTVRVVNGAIDESTALLDQRFEHIFYTGNGRVGSIVAAKAARWLCPTTLELGGKSPVIIDKTANLAVAAHRIVWAKTFNAGQTCIAPDYILIDRSVQDKFIEEVKKVCKGFWPESIKASKNFSRIVSDRHWKRVHDLASKSKGEVVVGDISEAEESERFLPFVVLKNVPTDDSTMEDEIFGPVLPLVPIDNIRGAVDFINSRDQPLALYMFTNSDAVAEYILTYTRSGAAIRGDMLLHFFIKGLPFGGTGPAGYGLYHGKAGFDCFTHERAYVDAPSQGPVGFIVEKLLSLRYPPYSSLKIQLLRLSVLKYIFFGKPANPHESNTSITRGPVQRITPYLKKLVYTILFIAVLVALRGDN